MRPAGRVAIAVGVSMALGGCFHVTRGGTRIGVGPLVNSGDIWVEQREELPPTAPLVAPTGNPFVEDGDAPLRPPPSPEEETAIRITTAILLRVFAKEPPLVGIIITW